MSAAPERLPHDARISARTVLAAGGVVGVLDGIAAVLLRLALRGDFAPVRSRCIFSSRRPGPPSTR